MTTKLRPGPLSWHCTRDSESYRTYKVKYLVETDDPKDGPAQALDTAGLPAYGDTWAIDNDVDTEAWCRWDAVVTPRLEKEPNKHFEIEFTFSTKPPESGRCHTMPSTDPLLEPPKVSGSFVRYQFEETEDRFGKTLANSAHEQIRGPQVEFDRNRLQIKIEQNVANLQYPLLASMIDHLNAYPLWGLNRREIKLSGCSFERKFVGVCSVYYTRHLEFDIRRLSEAIGFDRTIRDEGTKVLNGKWEVGSNGKPTGNWIRLPMGTAPLNPDSTGVTSDEPLNPDPDNPKHFIRYIDIHGNPTKVRLNGHGMPAGVLIKSGTATSTSTYDPSGILSQEEGEFFVQVYEEADFTLLTIPLTF